MALRPRICAIPFLSGSTAIFPLQLHLLEPSLPWSDLCPCAPVCLSAAASTRTAQRCRSTAAAPDPLRIACSLDLRSPDPRRRDARGCRGVSRDA
ncbi:hypothetical protein ZEAMMB73_Zm00001d010419 [Zea mays]|uniref:Uncharacterized protein n=1 Tax=Zea mays TaxID=4577 RepID=A0A1D6FQW9_MAIZE|nr:hypothetical protein ZEAMMB73_Zm00001d010419 [Zea mays]